MYSKDIEFLQFRRLIEYSDRIEHCYTLKPLDFKTGDMDKSFADYDKICKALNINSKNIYRPSQTHSINIKTVTKEAPRNI